MNLTSAAISSPIYYSFEIHSNKLGLYLNIEDQKYSYWELKLFSNASISFVRLGSRGLKLFNKNLRKIGQIPATGEQAVRFLALTRTGNLELYYASKTYNNQIVFESSYQAVHDFCDLPLPCGLFGICTRSMNSTCLYLPKEQRDHNLYCDESYNSEMQMVELGGVDTVLRMAAPVTNSTEDECVSSCMEDCSCAAALYAEQECFHYGLVAGAKKVGRGAESSYWVKVLKDTGEQHGISSSLVKKILVLGEWVNVIAICCILGGLLYWILQIRCKTREISGTNND